MPLPMLRPQRHRTGVWRLRLAVPRDLRDACYRLYGARYELIANLHTRDHREARLRAASAEDMLRQKLEVARKHTAGMPARLSDRQIAALAGMVCGRELPALAEGPGNAGGGRDVAEQPIHRLNSPDDALRLRKADLDNATALLIEHGFVPDSDAVGRVAEAVWRARVLAAQLMAERPDGRWGPGKNGAHYPALDQMGSAAGTSGATASLDAVLSGWAADRGWTVDMKPKPHVLYDYIRVVERIADFVGHRDACRIDKADAVKWKTELQCKGRHAGTIRHIMSCCRGLWGWGIVTGCCRARTSGTV